MVAKMDRVWLDAFTRDIWRRFDHRGLEPLKRAILRRRAELAEWRERTGGTTKRVRQALSHSDRERAKAEMFCRIFGADRKPSRTKQDTGPRRSGSSGGRTLTSSGASCAGAPSTIRSVTSTRRR